MSDEIQTKEEHYQDWKSENLEWLTTDFFEENVDEWTHKNKSERFEEKSDDFEAYCRQQFFEAYCRQQFIDRD